MKVIVITPPIHFEEEQKFLHTMVLKGVWKIHLRKPGVNEEMIRKWLDLASPELRNCLVIHGHHHLSREYELDGIHFSMQSGEKDAGERASLSTHSAEEIDSNPGYRYYFYSPVFSSISKPGYSPEKLPEFSERKECIIALGGITKDRIALLPKGFSGVACLGSVWMSQNPVKAFEEIKKAVI